jgi:DNA processing protein
MDWRFLVNNLAYLIALHSVNGLGPIRLKLLLDFFKDPKLVWEAPEKELRELGLPRNALANLLEVRKKLEVERYFQEIQDLGIKVLTFFDEEYPKLLKKIYDPPIILYYFGEIPGGERNIGVVGTRKMTGYGRTVTEKLTRELVGYQFTVVSGLARGVDTEAHRTTVEAGGKTIAVLGGGLKRIFPPENEGLAKKIAEGFGAVVTEFPPDALSMPGNFPARNRIIAGLSLGVLVTEAAEDSGSLITARVANEEGREVFAVPGPITSSLSSGPSQLIKEGAKLVTSAEEILDTLGVSHSIISNNTNFKFPISNLSQLEKQIILALENEHKHIDELCRETSLKSSEISAALIKMEIMGFVKSLGGGNYSKSI